MSLLAFGGEMGFFVPSDANAIEGSASDDFNGAFARGFAGATGGASFLSSPTIATQADFWLHVDLDQEEGASFISTLKQVVTLNDNSGTACVRLLCASAPGAQAVTWQVEYLAATVWTSVGNFTADPTTLQTLDFHVVSNTASGSIDLYLSGTRRVASGTINLSGLSGIASVAAWGLTPNITKQSRVSQMILANESTIGLRLGTIVMTGQGSTHTFTAGGFANIDELIYSDADEIHSDTANQVELFTGTPVPSFTNYTIRAIGVYARAKKSGSGPAQLQLALRSAGTTYFSATKALDFGYGAYGNVWETNPATSAAFLSSEIAALEYGVKSVT